jgi:hypothetical protein
MPRSPGLRGLDHSVDGQKEISPLPCLSFFCRRDARGSSPLTGQNRSREDGEGVLNSENRVSPYLHIEV